MEAGIGKSLREIELVQRRIWLAIAVAVTLKVSNRSLRHLASYARIAIQISKISREQLKGWEGGLGSAQ
jgi:hypothetical protein